MLAADRLSPSRPRPGRAGAMAGGLAAMLLGFARTGLAATARHPGRVLSSLLIGGTAALIAQNALTAQPRRHPAPLFAAPRPVVPAEGSRTAERAEAARLPPARAQLAPPAAAAPKPASRDPIADLIRSEATGSTPLQSAKAEPQRSVVQAQRALVKLGYGPLKTDGVMGPGTRQALERFERDRHLPETGELGPRTARELAARAGSPLD